MPDPDTHLDVHLPRTVGQQVRRYRLDVEIVTTGGEWIDVQDKVHGLVAEEFPGAAVSVDLTEETLLVPDGRGEAGSRQYNSEETADE